MINFGSTCSGSTMGLPFSIMGAQPASVTISFGYFDENGDYILEHGPSEPLPLTQSGDFYVVFIPSEWNETEQDKRAHFYLSVTDTEQRLHIIEGVYDIKVLPDFWNGSSPNL